MNRGIPTAVSPLVGGAAAPKEAPLSEKEQKTLLIILGALVVALIYTYWNSFARVERQWATNPLYSHGYLIPAFAVVLMWMRREPFERATTGARWCGLLLLAIGLVVRITASNYYVFKIDNYSFVACLAGIFLLVGGWRTLRWAGPGIGFLVFMFPLPTRLETSVLINLQKFATIVSTYVLQLLGVIAHREGSVINIDDIQLNIVDACSGLRMLTIFVALAVAIVLVIDRPWWDRLIILLSAVPIALIVNIVRVTTTGIFYMTIAGESEWIQKFSHDGAGLFMMPLAMGLLYCEIQLLSQLAIAEDSSAVVAVGAGSTSPVRQR